MFFLFCSLVLEGGIAYLAFGRSDPPDTRFNGAYRLEDGRLVFITPSEGEILRYRLMSGQSSTLWPVGDLSYESGPGWRSREPIELRVDFQMPAEGGPPNALSWQPTDGPAQQEIGSTYPRSSPPFQLASSHYGASWCSLSLTLHFRP